ncbi:MAG TPA: site-specific DNA-methyltransferase [Candidatus Limnocylindria bacterium]|nr:site-specific DNA-methyltransferase [Candidatus Limnocylindria bacterium]
MKRPSLNRIYQGDAEQVLRHWPAGLVDLCVTSPPYYQLRDYGHVDQLGLEKAPEDYIRRLTRVLGQVRRVLKPQGSLYLNLGDTYRNKTLLGIPWRVVRELQRRGWYLRNAIVWHKPNGVPSAIKDRMTNHYEFVFHLTRSRRYYFDLDPLRIPNVDSRTRHLTGPVRRGAQGLEHRSGVPVAGNFVPDRRGKNPGDVWTIGPETRAKRYIVPGETTHFAPFPETIAERPILAASPARGVVLDPFVGSGTTALVARRHGRRYVGIELVPSFVKLARARLRRDANCSDRLIATCSVRRTARPEREAEKQRSSALSFSASRSAA